MMRLKTSVNLLCTALVGLGLLPLPAISQTDGSAELRATLLNYGGSNARHWTVVWVETESGTFIKTLWRQGPSIGSSHWNSHCRVWYQAKSGSAAFDGYSSATAQNYSGVNSPVILTWDCRDAGDNLVEDGDYRFWIQYAEDNGQGPYTTDGLAWTKGASALDTSYPDQGSNFADMQVVWTPVPPPIAPVITTLRTEGLSLVMGGNGPSNGVYSLRSSTDLALPVDQWTTLTNGAFDASGMFSTTNTPDGIQSLLFYQLSIP